MGKKIPMWQAVLVMLVMVALLVWSIVKDIGGEPHIALILAASFAAIIAGINGWKWAYLEQGILASINRSMQAILILAILGTIIASWMAAGTIPSMMYYGIKVISPKSIPGNGMYSMRHCIPGNRIILVNGRFHGCSSYGSWCSIEFPGSYDGRCDCIRSILRR